MVTVEEKNKEDFTRHFHEMSVILLTQLNLLQQQLMALDQTLYYEKITQNEQKLDKYENMMHDEAVGFLGLMSPKAGDLRLIIACLDMSSHVERTGDLVYSISKRLKILIHKDSVFDQFRLKIMLLYEAAHRMIQNAIFAFECRDTKMAQDVIEFDDEVDRLNIEIQGDVFALHRSDIVGETLREVLELGRVLYNMERIGDSATNIAESVIFMTEGKDIKHENISSR